MRSILLAALLFTCHTAIAVPVEWTLNDVTFESGAVATGQFTYDADTRTFANVNILVSERGALGVFDISSPPSWNFGNAPGSELNLSVNWGLDPVNPIEGYVHDTLYFEFNSTLTNSGGVASISPGSYEYESRSYGPSPEGGYTLWTDNIVSGTVSAVPIPAAVWLFGSGLGLLGFVRRRVS